MIVWIGHGLDRRRDDDQHALKTRDTCGGTGGTSVADNGMTADVTVGTNVETA
jgi:hypothetical protein